MEQIGHLAEQQATIRQLQRDNEALQQRLDAQEAQHADPSAWCTQQVEAAAALEARSSYSYVTVTLLLEASLTGRLCRQRART